MSDLLANVSDVFTVAALTSVLCASGNCQTKVSHTYLHRKCALIAPSEGSYRTLQCQEEL